MPYATVVKRFRHDSQGEPQPSSHYPEARDTHRGIILEVVDLRRGGDCFDVGVVEQEFLPFQIVRQLRVGCGADE